MDLNFCFTAATTPTKKDNHDDNNNKTMKIREETKPVLLFYGIFFIQLNSRVSLPISLIEKKNYCQSENF